MKKLILLLISFLALPVAAQVTVIKAGKLLDPETGTVSVNQLIIINGRNITAVGANLPIPAGAREIDLSAMTVMPGFMDCHTHMCAGAPSRKDVPRKAKGGSLGYDLGNTTAYRAIQGVANAKTMLETGFTTIRDIGNNGNYADVDLRRAITEGIVPGPTMITAGRIIAPFGGQYAPADRGYTQNPERPGNGAPEYFFADTKDELRKAIHQNVYYGSQMIKIVVDDQKNIYTADDLKFAVDECHRAGIKLATHCVTEQGARNAAEAGVDSIEHGFVMSDAVLELCKKNNVVLVGTDFTREYLQEYGQDAETRGRGYDRSIDRIKRAYRIGVIQAFGSDVIFDVEGKTRGEVCMQIVDSYIAAGLPNSYVMQMLTINAARLLDVANRRGAIKPGLAADIVATAENPLENIQTIKSVKFVMKEGVVYKDGRN